MSILFAGTSTADFLATGTPVSTTTAADINADALEGVRTNVSNIIEFELPAKYLDFWFACDYYDSGGNFSTGLVYFPFIGFHDKSYSTTEPLFSVGAAYSGAGKSVIAYYNGTAQVLKDFDRGDIFRSGSSTGRMRLDIHCKIADTGGVFELYIDGVLSASVTITDTLIVSTTGVNLVRLKKYTNTGSTYGAYSAVILADEDTRAMNLVALPYTAAGGVSGWTGAYTDINETGYSDATLLSTETLDAISTFVTTDIAAKYSLFKVRAVAVGGRGIKGASSPTTIQAVVRLSAINYAKASELATPAAMGPMSFIWQTSPVTSAAWTVSEVNAGEFGFKAAA